MNVTTTQMTISRNYNQEYIKSLASKIQKSYDEQGVKVNISDEEETPYTPEMKSSNGNRFIYIISDGTPTQDKVAILDAALLNPEVNTLLVDTKITKNPEYQKQQYYNQFVLGKDIELMT